MPSRSLSQSKFHISLKKLRAICQNSFLHYLIFVFGFPVSAMHREWIDALMKCSRVVIAAPRAHSKTTVVSIAYSTWLIGRNPNIRIKIITNSIDKGREILTAVSSTLLFNKRYQFVFPEVRPAKTRYWTKDRLYVERSLVLRDPTIEARSVLSTGAGGRSDVIIGDDMVDNLNCVTEGLRRKVKEAFYDTWMNTLEPQGNQAVVVGTIWHEDDLLSELLRNKDWEFRKVWAINDNFDPLWPQVWSREKLYKKWKENPLAFDKGFRHRPTRVDTALFPPSSFKQRSDWPLSPGSNPPEYSDVDPSLIKCYFGVDISAGHGDDFSVIFVVRVNAETLIRWPVEIARLKQPAPDVTRKLIRMYKQYQPEVIMIESNATQSMMQDWISEVSKLPLKPYYTGVQKHLISVGIPSLRVELDNNMWMIPSWDHPLECSCSWCQWKREVLAYPYSKRDDTVFAWWFSREAIRLFLEGKRAGRGYAVVEL